MKMYVPDITEIWDEILSEKMIKKNRQYGNSVYDEDTIFGDSSDVEELIKVRLDDKLRRMKTLSSFDKKYDSELMEIVAYIMHLLNWRRNSGKYEEIEENKETSDSDRYERNAEQVTDFIRKVCDSHLPTLGLRRLPDKQRRNLREEDFQ